MITTNTTHSPNTATSTPAPSVQALLRTTFEQLDVALDELHRTIDQTSEANPLLLARAAIGLDTITSEVRRLTGMLGRGQRPPFHHHGNHHPHTTNNNKPRTESR